MAELPPGLLIVGGSGSHVPFVEAARASGFHTVVVDRDRDCPAGRISDRFVPLSTYDGEGTLELARSLDSERGLAGALSYASDPAALASVAGVHEALGLPGYGPEVVRRTTDKAEMKRALHSAGVPAPDWAIASKESEALEFARSVRGPVLLKPARGTSGSLGVVLVKRSEDLALAFRRARDLSLDARVLVEKFHPGVELSVNGIVVGEDPRLLVVCRKANLGPDRGFIISSFWTLDADDPNARRAARLALDAVRALGIRDSFFAADVLVEGNEATLLEIGLLLDAKLDRLLAFSGRDFYHLACRLAAGRPVPETTPCPMGFALRFLFGREPDRSAGLQACAAPGATVEWERGSRRYPPGSLADAFGWVLARAEDSSAAYRRTAEIALRCGASLLDDPGRIERRVS